MPSLVGTELARSRSRLATATRLGSPEDVANARRDHAATRLALYIERTVAEAPPLTVEQRDRLTSLLHGAA